MFCSLGEEIGAPTLGKKLSVDDCGQRRAAGREGRSVAVDAGGNADKMYGSHTALERDLNVLLLRLLASVVSPATKAVTVRKKALPLLFPARTQGAALFVKTFLANQ